MGPKLKGSYSVEYDCKQISCLGLTNVLKHLIPDLYCDKYLYHKIRKTYCDNISDHTTQP